MYETSADEMRWKSRDDWEAGKGVKNTRYEWSWYVHERHRS